MYHRIAIDSFDPWSLAVDPANFADHLEWLSENRLVLPLAEFVARHIDHSLPSTAVALTFDDGYQCFAEVAAPLLGRLRLPATVFLPVELIERSEPFWWDELQSLVLGANAEVLSLDHEPVPLGRKMEADAVWPPNSPPQTPRQRAFERIWAFLRTKNRSDLELSMRQLRSQACAPAKDPPLKRPMTPDEVQCAARDGTDFGSHALTHPWLASLSLREKKREILESMDRLSALTGSSPTAFAYPYGNFDKQSENLVASAGFVCACTTGQRAVTEKSRRFALPRIGVGNWDATFLSRVVAKAY